MSHMKAVIAALLITLTVSASAAAEATGRQPMVRTSLSREQLVEVLRDSHLALYGVDPTNPRLAMAWAQVAGENLHGREIYNHNIGNVEPRGNAPYYVVQNQKYRSYDTFMDGAKEYWGVIHRCPRALVQFDAGAPNQAAVELKRCNYYGVEVSVYANIMSQLYRLALNTVIPNEERIRHESDELKKSILNLLSP